jgi:hypothetical protein
MYEILCVLLATIAYGTAGGHCQAPPAGTSTITFQSSTYGDFRQILAREAATGPVTIRATLGFPEEAKDRYPAVIIVHGIAGYSDAKEGYVAALLRKSGFATLTYDSFAARGTTEAAMSAWRTLTPRCGGWRTSPRSRPNELPFWVSRMVVKWRI